MEFNTGNPSMDAKLFGITEKNWKAKKLLEAVNGDFSKLPRNQKDLFYKEFDKQQQHKPIELKNEDDVAVQRNIMAFGNGNYPLSMTDCEVIGISGGCGDDCPVYKRGECKEANAQST